MLSVNAQGNRTTHCSKNGQVHTAGACFNEYNISQIKPAFDVVIKEQVRD
jgi:hypothetical protein